MGPSPLATPHLPERSVDAVFDARVESIRVGPRGASVQLHELRARGEAAPALPERALLRLEDTRDLRPGDQVRVRGRLRLSRHLSNPGQPLAPRDTIVRARPLHPSLWVRAQRSRNFGFLHWAEALRTRSARRLEGHGQGGALLAALSVGEARALGAETRDTFAALGTVHLLVVSGLHLSLVGALASGAAGFVLRRSVYARRGDPRRLALGFGLAAAALYALISGARVPVVRAWVLLAALACGRWLGFRRRGGRALAVAAAIVLWSDPRAAASAGAQLSFAACLGFLWARPLRAGPARWASLREALGASASAGAATLPVLLWHGLPASAWAPAANLVAVPWFGMVLLPVSLVSAVVSLADVDRAPAVLGEIAGGLVGSASVLAEATLDATAWAARRLPAPPDPIPGALPIGVACAGAAAALATRRLSHRVALSTAALLAASVCPPWPQEGAPRIVALDVGSGDATLLETEEAAVLVDAGFADERGSDLGRSQVVPALRALGATHLDALVLTHADADHRGGAASVLRSLSVRSLWLPPVDPDDPDAFAREVALARELGVAVEHLGAGERRRIADARFEVLWPPRGWRGTRNQRSLVLRAELGERGPTVLLPGDLDREAEAELLSRLAALPEGALRSQVLHVGHHGSRGSSSAAFLAAVDAQVALVSATCGRRGLPSPDTLRRLARAGAAVWWTARSGALTVRAHPLRVLPLRDHSACAEAR